MVFSTVACSCLKSCRNTIFWFDCKFLFLFFYDSYETLLLTICCVLRGKKKKRKLVCSYSFLENLFHLIEDSSVGQPVS